MATLGDGEDFLREITQHRIDTKLTQPQAWRYLNLGYRRVRTLIQDLAPTLYMATSSEITFDDVEISDSENEIVLSDDDVNFDHIAWVERRPPSGSRFSAIEGGNQLTPTDTVHNGVSFTIEHKCLRLHHPAGKTGGTYRVRHWIVPVALDDINQSFQVPSSTYEALVFFAAGLVMVADGGAAGMPEKAKWDEMAKASLADAEPALKGQYGFHQDTSGVRRVMWR